MILNNMQVSVNNIAALFRDGWYQMHPKHTIIKHVINFVGRSMRE